ncbi:zinc-dependent peptidase [Thiolinea disciformis]|uniref:M90 family metallopeptidase n=1 Tax=Thiolinea disciformis TaxID=125614 RepID=UPI0004759DB4|nr:M90 family metallopeptidase [Thiolinea disciformis]
MSGYVWSLFLLLAIISGAIAWWLIPYYALRKAINAPFPEAWRRILARNFPIYRHLPSDLQRQLQKLIKQFIHEKHFTGCNGLEITDEIRVTIAASACLLLLNRKTSVYGDLRYILVYPDGFITQEEKFVEGGIKSLLPSGLLGQSWSNGKVILSWADVLKGNREFRDGHNVALHEFAHQLDNESGSVNGAPVLANQQHYQRWASVLTEEYEALRRAAFQGDETLIDQYGATAPAEFFAVVTETFFERPLELLNRHPALFNELKIYYKVDPSDWMEA